MQNLHTSIATGFRWFSQYCYTAVFLLLFFLSSAGNLQAQGGSCGLISYTFEDIEPCKFRARYQNTSDCYSEIRYILTSGQFASWTVNSAAGFTLEVISPSELWIRHNGGFIPTGNQVPLQFTLPPDLNTTMGIAWLDNCQQVGCELFGGIPIESCPDPKNASIIGVKYKECGILPYSNQTVIPDWPIQLLDTMGNVLSEQFTDILGVYAFYDLPYGVYRVKETQQPGWTAKVPASGQYTVDLNPSQQAVQNFGNCPNCSCDSIALSVQPISKDTGVCCYRVIVQSRSSVCFGDIFVEVPPALSINTWSLSAPGWTVVPISPQVIRIFKPGNAFIPFGTVLPINFCVTGGTVHDISISTSYSNGFQSILCETDYKFDCAAQGDCPDNYVKNGNFEQGTPPGPDESIGFAPFWSAIWTGCSSTADFYNTVFAPPFGVLNPMPVSQGNFGGMWAKPHPSNLNWREGMMNQIVTIPANSGMYSMTAKFACLTPVQPTPSTPLPVIEVWGVPVGPPLFGACPGLTGPNSSIFPGAILLNAFTPTANCDKNFQTFNNITFSAPPNVAIDRIFFTRQQPVMGQQGSDVYIAIDDICLTKISPSCVCRQNDVMYNTAGSSVIIPCKPGPNAPVFFCPTGPVTITGDFGCVDASGKPCLPPSPVAWVLTRPNGTILQGTFQPGTSFNLPFTATDLSGSGLFTLHLATLCPGQTDSCICDAEWFQECVPVPVCECDAAGPFDMSIRYGGALNTPIDCGDVVPVTPNSVVNIDFQCQGANCNARVDWVLTDPNGNIHSMMAGMPAPTINIPPLQPTNFQIFGTYTLKMLGICGQDTCPCTVYFCLPPPPPELRDSSICRADQTAYIPLYGCPTTCGNTQVRWFVKPCLAPNFPLIPYQVSSGPNCADLLLLPYQYPNETCVNVYAEITLDGSCCNKIQLISNVATINLCSAISCSINNPNTAGFCQCGTPQALTAVPANANCGYTVQWYYQGQLIPGATGLSYQPGQLCFQQNAASDCWYDHVFKAEFNGECGPSSCNTTIRVYDPNAPVGTLDMVPFEDQPFCPGEDATLCYTDKCAGTPPKWTWYTSTVDPPSFPNDYTAMPNWGTMNPKINTNKLWQTTWYLVERQNGVCPPNTEDYRIEVKDAIVINNFMAVTDPCVDSYVMLTLDFTPTPITGAVCQYVIDWYHNGNLIHTSTSLGSPASFTYPSPTPGMGSMAGVYYAVVRDNCCPRSAQTWPIVLNPTCVPGISGPCYVCDKTTPYTLYGDMVLPPQDPCPPGPVCIYQWYQLDITTGNWIPVGTPNSQTFATVGGGHFRFESTCDYGYGPCIRNAYHDVAQCENTGNGCKYVDAPEVILPIGMQVVIHPNPTTGSMTVQISPTPLRNGHLEIVDVNGKMLASDMIPENQASHTLSLSHLPSGIYLVRVFESDVLVWVGKVVRSE